MGLLEGRRIEEDVTVNYKALHSFSDGSCSGGGTQEVVQQGV